MENLRVGSVVGVRCEVKPGPFAGERLVSFETVDGSVSGFVREDELKTVSDKWYVRAVVQSMDADVLQVRIRGSFFTTNGIAKIPRDAALAA
jgi:hypothetical protein